MIRKGWIGLWALAVILWTLVFFPRNTSSTEIELIQTRNSRHSSPVTDTISHGPALGQTDSVEVENREQAKPGNDEIVEDPTCINVNTAGKQQLQTLSGVGPVLAERIIVYRNGTKKFSKPTDLTAVKGIGPATVEKNRKLICF